jgi:hypothetical protein
MQQGRSLPNSEGFKHGGNSYGAQKLGDVYKHVLCHSENVIAFCITADLNALL